MKIYRGSIFISAGRIADIDRAQTSRLHFDCGSWRDVSLDWMTTNKPAKGGFVIETNGKTLEYLSEQAFQAAGYEEVSVKSPLKGKQ